MNNEKKIVLLTTKTSHHFFFINQMAKICNLFVVFEKKILKPNFKIVHNYEKKQILYEKKKWFKNGKIKIQNNIDFINSNKINDVSTIDYINLIKPDIIFSFGVSRINENLLDRIKKPIYNFHGGDTSFYRGLDSHLWSLYHNDLRGLKVTLHQVDKNLDTGSVIIKKKLNLKKSKYLYQLRSINTELCIKLAFKLIKKSKIKKIKQNKIGRYYSFMPVDLKNLISKKYKGKLKKIYNDY
jgi:methionyl-tRNA formyltransferase